jgi:hypothetical protein
VSRYAITTSSIKHPEVLTYFIKMVSAKKHVPIVKKRMYRPPEMPFDDCPTTNFGGER